MAKMKTSKGQKDSPDAKLEALMGQRIAYAFTKQKPIIAAGDSYARFIQGDAPASAMIDGDEDEGTDAQREEKAVGKGWQMTSVPMHGMLRQVLLPALVSRAPTFVNRGNDTPAPGEPEELKQLRQAKARVWVQLAKKIYSEMAVHQEVLAAVDDAMPYTCGWLEVDFDKERKLPRIRWQNTQRVLVDAEVDSDPFGHAHRWRGVCWTMPLSEAQYLARKVWKTDHEFSPVSHEWDEAGREEVGYGAQELPTKFVRLVRVYVKGDSPWISDAKLDAKPGAQVEAVGEDDVYKGKNEVLIFEAQGSWEQSEQYKLVARFPWPYTLDHDEFPLEPVRITHSNDNFFPYSVFQPAHSLQISLNWAVRYFNTDAYNSSRRVIGFLESVLKKSTVDDALYGTENLAVVPFQSTGDMERAWKSLDFGKPAPQLQEAITGNDGLYREVSGLNAFDAEGKSHETAARALLDNQGTQLRIGAMADRVELAIKNAMRKALMCAFSLMTAEEVGKWIGPEYMDFQKIGNTLVSPYWDDTIDDPDAIRREVDINIEPRSVRFVSPEQEIADIERLMTKMNEFAAQIQGANQTNPALGAAMAKSFNTAIRAMAERLHIPNADELLFDLNLASTPPAPEPAETPTQTMSASTGPDGSRSMDIEAPVGAMPQAVESMANQMASLNLEPGMIPGQLGNEVAAAMPMQGGA